MSRMIISIAWKNVWRNKTRSLIVIAAVAIGVFAGVFAIAAMNSSVIQRTEDAVNLELSHIQVNTKDFRSNTVIQNTLPHADSVLKVIQSFPGVKAVTERLIVRGIASSSGKSCSVEINGIDTQKEKEIFKLNEKLIPGTGTWFESATKYNMAFIGEKLAKDLNIIRFIITPDVLLTLKKEKVPAETVKKLEPVYGQRFISDKKFDEALRNFLTSAETKKYGIKIKEAAWSFRPGSKIILSFLDVNENQTGAVFRVCGIFRTNNDMFEATSLFVPMEELRKLSGLEKGVAHRLVCRLREDDLTDEITPKLREALTGLEVLNWKEIQPDLAMISDMMQQVYAVFMAIILLALAFGIVNTMLMSVLERTKELGMLAAIGMNRKKIFSMIMLESVFLSTTGGGVGMAVAGIAIAATARHGINLVKYSEGLEAFGYSAHLFPTIDLQFFITTSLLIILTGILSSVYPARKALQLKPVDALRTE